jgi:gas vesicle protein
MRVAVFTFLLGLMVGGVIFSVFGITGHRHKLAMLREEYDQMKKADALAREHARKIEEQLKEEQEQRGTAEAGLKKQKDEAEEKIKALNQRLKDRDAEIARLKRELAGKPAFEEPEKEEE